MRWWSGNPAEARLGIEEAVARLFPPQSLAPAGGLAPAGLIGAELELLAFTAETYAVARLDGELGEWLRDIGTRDGWRSTGSDKGAPKYTLSGGGTITLEPGGQVEYSSPPFASPSLLIDDLQRVGSRLVSSAASHGVALMAVGIDPFNDIAQVPLQLTSERYARMDAYFASIGPSGARMMRQTAALQISIDPVHDADLTWSVLNRAAPMMTALFANSRTYAGADSGYASYRAHMWRGLDPGRTGIVGSGDGDSNSDAIAAYTRFATEAPFIGDTPPYVAFGAVPRSDADVEYHLSTLFPEIRPKGYYEVRCIDAIPIEFCAAPILFVAGLCADAIALRAADAVLDMPVHETPVHDMLACAAEQGMADDVLRARARALVTIAEEACVRAGDSFACAQQIEILRTWTARSLAA